MTRPTSATRASRSLAVLGVWSCLLLAGCGDSEPTAPPDPATLVERYGLESMPAMVHPRDNPPDPTLAALGRLVFFDPIQSAGKDVACATCHIPRLGFADGRDLPLGPSGEGLGPERRLTDPAMVPEGRHSPSIINVGFNRFRSEWTADGFMFWDGRMRRLENLVMLPQREFSEMRGDGYPVEVAIDTVLSRLRGIEEYEALFREAFPENAEAVARGERSSAIDSLAVARSLAQFIRSVTSTDAPYDRFVAGDPDALDERQKRGLVLFHEKAHCADCHSGPMFSDFDFHVVGARQLGPGFQGTPHEDLGRWVATRIDADRYRFRTPTLRNVTLTAPYMHSGGYASLRDVVEFFARGGGDHPRVPAERLEVEPLDLTEREVDDLIAFLEALTDAPDVTAPDRVPSGLEVPR